MNGRWKNLTVFVAFIILAVAMTYPAAFHAANAMSDLRDPLLVTWNIAWDTHKLTTAPFNLFNANIYYPYPNTLAFDDFMLGIALLALPVLLATNNSILAYNWAWLLSFVLSGFGAYLLALRITRNRLAGIVAGIIFAFFPWRFAHLNHLNLLAAQWMPFALLALDRVLRRGSWQDTALLAIFFVAQSLSSWAYGLYLTIAMGVYAFVAILARLPMRRNSLVSLTLAVVLSLAVLLPFAMPYLQVERELGLKRSLGEVVDLSADWQDFLSVPKQNLVHGNLLAGFEHQGNYPDEHRLFPGIMPVFLALIGVGMSQTKARWFYAALAATAAILAFGPSIMLPSVGLIPLPYQFLYEYVPGLQGLRAPVRFDVLLMLGLSILAALGVVAIGHWIGNVRSRRPGLRVAVGCVIILLIGIEYLSVPVRTTPVEVGDSIPPVYRWLAQQPTDIVIVELPLGSKYGSLDMVLRAAKYQYLSTVHWHPTITGGFASFVPPTDRFVVSILQDFPSELALTLLREFDVRYVIVHTDVMKTDEWNAMQDQLAQFASDVSLAERFGSDFVYTIRPAAQEWSKLRVQCFIPKTIPQHDNPETFLIITNETPHIFVAKPTRRVHVLTTWMGDSASPSRTIPVALPLLIEPGAVVLSVSLNDLPTPGHYRLGLSASEPGSLTFACGSGVDVVAAGSTDTPRPVPIQFVDFETDAKRYRPGDAVRLTLHWRARARVREAYGLLVRMVTLDGQTVAQAEADHKDDRPLTIRWRPGEIFEDRLEVHIPAQTWPGIYGLEVVMHSSADRQPLLTLNEYDQPVEPLVIGSIEFVH